MTNSMSCIRASRLCPRLLIRTPICTAPAAGSAKYGVTSSMDCGSSRPSASTTTTMTLSGSRAGQAAAAGQVPDPGVERLALALPRLRRRAAQQPDPLAEDARDRVRGAVVRAVVDHQDHEVLTRDGQQPPQAVDDDLLLVQARHHEHEEQAAAGGRKLAAGDRLPRPRQRSALEA